MDELAQTRAFTLQVAERLYLASSVLGHLAERRKPKGPSPMNYDTRELLTRMEAMTDLGCRPSLSIVRDAITTIQRQDAQIADLQNRLAQSQNQLNRHERESQRVD